MANPFEKDLLLASRRFVKAGEKYSNYDPNATVDEPTAAEASSSPAERHRVEDKPLLKPNEWIGLAAAAEAEIQRRVRLQLGETGPIHIQATKIAAAAAFDSKTICEPIRKFCVETLKQFHPGYAVDASDPNVLSTDEISLEHPFPGGKRTRVNKKKTSDLE